MPLPVLGVAEGVSVAPVADGVSAGALDVGLAPEPEELDDGEAEVETELALVEIIVDELTEDSSDEVGLEPEVVDEEEPEDEELMEVDEPVVVDMTDETDELDEELV